jgi:hypothetical protein
LRQRGRCREFIEERTESRFCRDRNEHYQPPNGAARDNGGADA